MKICIVGGTGNISSCFIPLLLQRGDEVVLFNRGKSAAAPDGVRVITGDRNDRATFESTMRKEKFDAAIDMICFNREDAESDLRAFAGIGHLVHCSTVCTYGVEYDWLPATEDHPLRPFTEYGRGKVAADSTFLRAHYESGFPVTIIKPSTTYGPKMGLQRQVAWMDFSWITRIRQGKPLVVCGDGTALHQFLHVDDAAPCFVNVLGRKQCFGQIYNMTHRGFCTWVQHHKTAMKVLGREVDLIGVPYSNLEKMNIPGFGICREIYAHHTIYDAEKLFRDVPEFSPEISLEEGMGRVIEAMDRDGRISATDNEWEDRLIRQQRSVGC